MIRYAKNTHNLTISFTPFFDPYCNSWRACAAQSYDGVKAGDQWRGSVGKGFNQSQWAAFFDLSDPQSYASFVLYYAALAQRAGADEYYVSHELMTGVRDGPVDEWVKLIAAVRASFKGTVATALNWSPFVTSHPQQIVPSWLHGLDYVGVDCYFPNTHPRDSDPRPWVLPSLQDMQAGWTEVAAGGTAISTITWVDALRNYSRAAGHAVRHAGTAGMMPIVCTEVGYQSRPAPWIQPPGVHDLDDAACDMESACIVPAAQALAYETLFSTLYPKEWFGGFYLWLWRADPSSGGMSDDQFGPQGKIETHAVLDKYWAGAGAVVQERMARTQATAAEVNGK
jgi:hypothetical protein